MAPFPPLVLKWPTADYTNDTESFMLAAIVTGVIIRNLPSKASKVEAVNNIIIMLSIAFLGKRFTFAAV